jgi:putative ABC transport system ATP-binding protein
MQPVLTFTQIEHAYAGKKILRARWDGQRAISHLNPGESALLMGPSGSGKSTLLTIFSGLLLPTQGSVEVKGIAWQSLSETARDRHRALNIGVMPQTAHLLPTLNVLDNVLLPDYFANGRVAAKSRALSLLESAGLSHRTQARVQTLSQGETQRVALCRALINQPALLLADEPTANLDDVAAAQATRMLIDAAREHGAALVIATHDARVKNQNPAAQIWSLQTC